MDTAIMVDMEDMEDTEDEVSSYVATFVNLHSICSIIALSFDMFAISTAKYLNKNSFISIITIQGYGGWGRGYGGYGGYGGWGRGYGGYGRRSYYW